MTISYKFKFTIIFVLISGILTAHENKIAIGGFSADGMTKEEKSWFINQLETKAASLNYSIFQSSEIVESLSQNDPNLLTCIREECSKVVADLLDVRIILLPEVQFHEKGVNVSLFLYSAHHFRNIAEVTEEHPPLKLSAVTEIFMESYLPGLLEEYEVIVRPEIQILQPAKFSPIQENHELSLLLNISDNRGLDAYTVYFSADAGENFEPVKSGKFNNEILMENFAISVPVSSGITDQAKIRVVVKDSDGNFRTRNSDLFSVIDNTPPDIEIKSPKKAEIIKGSNEFNIEWTGKDNLGIESYYLSYSKDNRKTWKNIVELDGTFSHFVWNVPDLLTNECYLKLKAADFSGLISEVEVGPVSIMDGLAPNLRLLTSMADRELPENSAVNFTLGFNDNTGVKIAEAYYTMDQVSFSLLHQTIFDNLVKDDTLTISLVLPTGLSSSARLKWIIKDLFENETSLQTHSFKVTDNTAPVNTIIYPIDGVRLKGKEKGKVIWEASDNTIIVQHEIFYSENGGKTWLYIGKVEGNKNNFIWDIPDIRSNEMRVKVTTTDAVGLKTNGLSALFEVYDALEPVITLVKPEILKEFDEKSTVNFEILIEDNIQLKLAEVYLKHGFQSQRIGSAVPDENQQLIKIEIEKQLIAPPGDSLQLIIIAKDEADNSTEYSSNKFVLRDITPPVVRFETTMSGRVLDGNSKFDIHWHARDNVEIESVNLEFSNDGFTWKDLFKTSGTIYTHNWEVPNLQETECKLRLSAKDINGYLTVVESEFFSILDKSGPELTILFPIKGTSLKEYETIMVNSFVHDDYGLGLVELWFSQDGNSFTYYSNEAFTSNVKNDSVQFTFSIPQGLSENAAFKFIAIDRFNNEKEYFSEYFTVTDNTKPVISFTKDIVDNQVETGEPARISWTMSDNDQLSSTYLGYSVDNGLNWSDLTKEDIAGKEKDQLFIWVVPVTYVGLCQLRATTIDLAGLSTSTVYNDINIIDRTQPDIKWISPNFPLTALEGEPLEITALITDNHSLNTIEYYFAADGKRYTFLHSLTGLSGKELSIAENIGIPVGVAENSILKLVVVDSNGNASSIISERFKVRDNLRPEIKITANVPENVNNGDLFTLEWESSDNEVLRSHRINFSQNGGADWKKLDSLPGTNRIWTWNVPDIVTKSAKMEIIAEDHVHLFDTVYTDLFKITDATPPEIKIPLSADRIEVKEGGILTQSILLYDNVSFGSIKTEYSNVPRQYSEISVIDLSDRDTNQINLEIPIPIPSGVTKNAKVRFTVEDGSGNSIQDKIRGIRIKDNTPPEVNFTAPLVENEENPQIVLVGDNLVFKWDGKDNTGIRSYKMYYRMKTTEYITRDISSSWVHIITLPGSMNEFVWEVPEKVAGECQVKIIITDRVGLTDESESGPFAIEDILDSSRDKHLRKYGVIDLSTFPEGAQVMLDNIEQGYTPLTLSKVTTGTHQLALFKENFHHISRLINVQADSTVHSIDSLKIKTKE